MAIFITTTTYIVMVFVAGATVMRDATGDIEDVVNGTLIAMNCTGKYYSLISKNIYDLSQ